MSLVFFIQKGGLFMKNTNNMMNFKYTAEMVYRKLVMVAAFLYIAFNTAYTAYATTEAGADATAIANQVTGPINTLTTIIVTIFAAFGGLWLAKVVPELITAIQERDSSGIFHAARSAGCALLLGGLPLIIKLFG